MFNAGRFFSFCEKFRITFQRFFIVQLEEWTGESGEVEDEKINWTKKKQQEEVQKRNSKRGIV